MSELVYKLENLDLNKTYSYADYLMWRFKERVELFKGKIWAMSPAPNRRHQKYSQNLNFVLHDYLAGQTCDLYTAPFDVRLLDKKKSKVDKDVYTVVQPDLCVICDRSKLDDLGCIGAPDLVVEILSPGNSKKEMDIKFDLYQEAGVREYWIVQPADHTVFIYVLENERYIGLKPFTEGQFITSQCFPGLKVEVAAIFKD
jgi:Uma2 family endonuclease